MGRLIRKINSPLDGATVNFVVYGQEVAFFKLAYTNFQLKTTLSLHLAYVLSVQAVVKMEKEDFSALIKHFY